MTTLDADTFITGINKIESYFSNFSVSEKDLEFLFDGFVDDKVTPEEFCAGVNGMCEQQASIPYGTNLFVLISKYILACQPDWIRRLRHEEKVREQKEETERLMKRDGRKIEE